MSLYTDDAGRPIVTQSMIREFRKCKKAAEYKYKRRLKPKRAALPLRRGSWMHSLLEEHYAGNDWREKHSELSKQFADLFDEEKDSLGDLPTQCRRLMRSYLWHYAAEELTVHSIEEKFEVEMPGGLILRLKVDMIVEDEFGLWAMDHKTHKRLPDMSTRLMDLQSMLYVWALIKLGIPVQGFIWNYLRTEGLKVPPPLQSGKQLARWNSCDLDYPTAVEAIRAGGVPVAPHKEKLRYLKSLRWEEGAPQRSTYFRRERVERSRTMLKRTAAEALQTAKDMSTYFERVKPIAVERTTGRHCSWCAFEDACYAQLSGGDDDIIVRRLFRTEDPMAYYDDDKKEF